MGEPDGVGADRRHREGRGLPARAQRSRWRGAAAVHPLVRGGRLHGHDRPDRQHLRPPAGPQPRPAAGHDRQPSRHPADWRPVRRRLWGDGRARNRPHPERSRLRDRGAGRDRRLDQRGRLAVFAGDGRLRGVRRGVRPRPTVSSGRTTSPASPSAPNSNASALPGPSRSAGIGSPPISRRISSRGRSSKRRGSRSASSPARRASAGTRSPSPGRRRMPGRRRCRAGATRWSAPRG